MDALSEALLAVRVTGAIFFRVHCHAPWGFSVPDLRVAAPLLAPDSALLVNYHLVTEGAALVRMNDGEEFRARAGDIVVLPYGDAHTVSSGRVRRFVDGSRALDEAVAGRPGTIRIGAESGPPARIVCGFIGCDQLARQLFLAGLPRSFRIGLRGEREGRWLEDAVEHLAGEAEQGRPGAGILLSRMAESLFVEALRRFMDDLPQDRTGWLAGARDPVVGRALALLHRRPADHWTLEALGREIGASRPVLAKRFSALLHESPMSYLRRWRLHLAAERLRTSRDAIVQVALHVGYDSEAAFSRAFRSEFGMPPGQYRRRLRTG